MMNPTTNVKLFFVPVDKFLCRLVVVFLACVFCFGCESESVNSPTKPTGESGVRFGDTGDRPNRPASERNMSRSNDKIALVDWTPLIGPDDNCVVANVITLRFPMPENLKWNHGGPQPIQGGPTQKEQWERKLVRLSIGKNQLLSFGRVGVIVDASGNKNNDPFAMKPFTHFDASFVILPGVLVADQEISFLQETVEFSQMQFNESESSLECSYQIGQILNLNRGIGGAMVILRLNKLIKVEQIKIGHREVSVVYNGTPVIFRGKTDAKAKETEKTISIRVSNVDSWIPLDYRLPYRSRANPASDSSCTDQ